MNKKAMNFGMWVKIVIGLIILLIILYWIAPQIKLLFFKMIEIFG